MTRRAIIHVAAGFSLGLIGGALGLKGLAGFEHAPSAVEGRTPYSSLRVFGLAYDTIRKRYVEEPDNQKLVDAALSAMVASLDPHSSFVPGKDLRALEALYRGESNETGAELAAKGDKILIAGLVAGSSAATSGLQIGDTLIEIDGFSTRGLAIDEVLAKTRGNANSSVRLTTIRGAERQILDFTVKRDVVKTNSVTWRVEGGDIGYIRIGQFTESAAARVKAAMLAIGENVPATTLKGYILDLRGDPGGFIDQAVAVVNAFVDGGDVVSTRGRSPKYQQVFKATPGANVSGGKPLIVLIDGATASAAEIVAGALQDLGRARIVGMRSFGKGSMQETISLGSEGALRLTTAQYYLPSGRSIQARGVEPDVEVRPDVPAAQAASAMTHGEASLVGHLSGRGEEQRASQAYVPTDPLKDTQLIAALALLHGDALASRPLPRK